MPIDDAAGRKAVRERRVPSETAPGAFLAPAAHRGSGKVLRDDLHRQGLEAARRALKAHKGGGHAARDERS